MKTHYKIASLMVIVAIIFSCFISCDTNTKEATATTYSYSENTTDGKEDGNGRDSISDDIPNLDFGGIDFKIFCREDKKY